MTLLVPAALVVALASSTPPSASEVRGALHRALDDDYQHDLPSQRAADQGPAGGAARSQADQPPPPPAQQHVIHGGGALGSLAQGLLWVLMVVAVGLAAFWLAREMSGYAGDVGGPADGDDRDGARAGPQGGPDRAVVERPLGDADQLAGQGRFGEAIHVLLLRTFEELARRQPQRLPPALTSREILARIPMPDDARAALGGLVGAVEVSHFGGAEPVAGDFQILSGALRAVRHGLSPGARVNQSTPAASEGGFSRRTAGWLIGVSAVSLVAAVLFAVFGGSIRPGASSSADTFSRSAIGHHGIISLLERLHVPVLVSQADTARRVAGDAALVVAEPTVGIVPSTQADDLTGMIHAAHRALVVLPKWYGEEDPTDPQRIDRAFLLPTREPDAVLEALGITGGVDRLAPDDPAGAPRAALWEADPRYALAGAAAVAPDLVGAQLYRGDDLEPIVRSDRGILVGRLERGGTTVWVLTDPDVLSNHGLLRGDNASLAVALLDQVRDGQDTLVFDETLHGFKHEPSPWKVLFEFPLALATIQALVAVALLLWAATGRFGKPLPPPPPLAPGKDYLIDNTAALLGAGGHAGAALRRYLATTVQDVARSLHAPPQLTAEATIRWLDGLAGARAIAGPRLAELEHEVAQASAARRERARRVAATARRIYRWKQEMTHGSGHSSRAR